MKTTAFSPSPALLAAALALAAGPLAAQSHDHAAMHPAAQSKERAKPTPSQPDSHAGHPATPASGADPGMDHAAMGHAPSATTSTPVDHAAMGHMASPQTPRTPIPPLSDADRAAAVAPAHMHAMHDNGLHSYVLFNRLETWDADPGRGLGWEAQGWIGTDLDRLWLRSEGERSDGHTESADLEVLYGRSVAPWWDLVAGVRHDFKPGDAQTFAAFGVQGLAPQKFEVSATAYLGERGQTAARLEAEYELLLTNRLILQPLVEATLFGKDDPARGIGAGLGTVEAGLRLRYEFTRKFAPYVGVVHERAFGKTADLRRGDGEPGDDTRIVVGLRTWF
ncbi:copper resistance protein B [Luteimonas aquatica]|uniref:copper resistance protein B n=1 Tax=Luteimonas aquatica TaxID=450364 RepID=UPI001F59FE44|nr:copper resistance protein B [Luteimonas aquatica]